MTMENKNKKGEKGKTGLIPNEQIEGSDADKAYDENGNFEKEENSKKDPEKSDTPDGSDASH